MAHKFDLKRLICETQFTSHDFPRNSFACRRCQVHQLDVIAEDIRQSVIVIQSINAVKEKLDDRRV